MLLKRDEAGYAPLTSETGIRTHSNHAVQCCRYL